MFVRLFVDGCSLIGRLVEILAKITNELVKLLDKVESHLDNNYKGWD